MIQGAGGSALVLNTRAGRLVESALPALPLDADFGDERVQLRDFNGDGVLDLVRADIRFSDASVRVWYGLGHGRYGSERRMSGVPLGDGAEFSLQDANGDGQADLVLVSGTRVNTYLNDGAGRFLPPSGSDLIGIPRTEVDWQLFADMNGNGTTDVVWVTTTQGLVYLELSNPFFGLLERIDNGMGAVTELLYRSSTSYLVDSKLDGD